MYYCLIKLPADEEEGGLKGMAPFRLTDEFKNLNIGFALDEGIPSDNDQLFLTWAERAPWRVEFTALGQSGHGSLLHNNTAAEKIQKVINAMLELRTQEKNRLEANNLTLGDVTTINLTVMKGGSQENVVPAELSVIFDIRITPYWNFTYVEDLLEGIRASAGPQVSLNYLSKHEMVGETPLTPENIWWTTFQAAVDEAGITLVPLIHPAATDIRYIRDLGIPAFGFTALTNTPILAHDHDEFVNGDVFFRGIKLYEQILPKLFNLK